MLHVCFRISTMTAHTLQLKLKSCTSLSQRTSSRHRRGLRTAQRWHRRGSQHSCPHLGQVSSLEIPNLGAQCISAWRTGYMVLYLSFCLCWGLLGEVIHYGYITVPRTSISWQWVFHGLKRVFMASMVSYLSSILAELIVNLWDHIGNIVPQKG